MISLLIPVLDRPHRVAPFLEQLEASLDPTLPIVLPVFLCSQGDEAQIAAVHQAAVYPKVVPWPQSRGDYAKKINYGLRETQTEWVFLGADDLAFQPGWLAAALACHERTGACVVGTNDLGNNRVTSGEHSTHTLVHRDYLECGTADEPGLILHEGYWHNFCNPPNAPIWMADLTFRDLGDVSVGDEVVGWERVPSGQHTAKQLCRSKVLEVTRRRAPLVKVTMESGRTLLCTPDHLWANAAWSPSSRHGAEWVTAAPGRNLHHIVTPPEWRPNGFERERGWLAGIYDGEGSGMYLALQSGEANPAVVAEIERVLRVLGIPHSSQTRPSGIVEFLLTGGRQGYVDFLALIEPVKRERLAGLVLGGRGRTTSRRAQGSIGARRFGTRDKVVHVMPNYRNREVVSMRTSTGNYVAWGYASKNCDDEFVGTAKARQTFAFAAGSRVEHLHPHWGKARRDATYELGQARFEEDRHLYNRRRTLWHGVPR